MTAWESSARSAPSAHSHPWMARVLFALDVWLRRGTAVVEYSSDPACLFRLAIDHAAHPVVLRDGTRLGAGDRVVRLHFWNEHVPIVPRRGATIGWARQMHQAIALSLRELAVYLSSRPDLGDVTVICADVPNGTRAQSGQVARIMAHYGFETIAAPERLSIGERVHRFGENFLISLVVLAQNAKSLRLDTLWRVRVPIFMSRRGLEARFGHSSAPVSATEAAA